MYDNFCDIFTHHSSFLFKCEQRQDTVTSRKFWVKFYSESAYFLYFLDKMVCEVIKKKLYHKEEGRSLIVDCKLEFRRFQGSHFLKSQKLEVAEIDASW